MLRAALELRAARQAGTLPVGAFCAAVREVLAGGRRLHKARIDMLRKSLEEQVRAANRRQTEPPGQ